jgi:TldD protein
VTLVDDPREASGRVRLLVDDEGRETRATVLIEAGVLRGFLADDATCAATHGVPTASARRESYRCASLPRMTNLVMAGGEQDPADLLKPIARGLLVERLGRGQVDPRRGEFRLEVESGRLIEGGRAGRPIAGAFLVGSCRELLRSIDGVGADVRTDPGAGACIKDDQIVPVGQAAPSLRVSKVRVLPGVGP